VDLEASCASSRPKVEARLAERRGAAMLERLRALLVELDEAL
jgi:hypothetical protein